MDIEIILEPDSTPQEVAEIAVEAEKRGVRALWTSNYHNRWDAFMSLVPAAQATSKIKLGVLAVSPYEMHPIKIAHSLITLNDFAKGRAMVAIGGGGSVLGATTKDFDFKKMRIVTAVREAIEIVHSFLDREFHFKYEGDIFNVTRPYKIEYSDAPKPRVYACSTGPQMLRMAGRVADSVHMSDVTPELITQSLDDIKTGLAKREVPAENFRSTNFWAWHIKPDLEDSMLEARRELVFRGALCPPFNHLNHYLSEEECRIVKEKWDYFAFAYFTRTGEIDDDEVPPELVEKCIRCFASAGDESNIDHEIERLKVFKNAGLDDLAIRLFDDPMDGLKMITEHVMPALK